MSKVTIQLKDIQLAQLNNDCLKQVVKFLRALKAHNGVSLRMQDADILLQISDQSHRTRNKELKGLYADLKSKILESMRQTLELDR